MLSKNCPIAVAANAMRDMRRDVGVSTRGCDVRDRNRFEGYGSGWRAMEPGRESAEGYTLTNAQRVEERDRVRVRERDTDSTWELWVPRPTREKGTDRRVCVNVCELSEKTLQGPGVIPQTFRTSLVKSHLTHRAA